MGGKRKNRHFPHNISDHGNFAPPCGAPARAAVAAVGLSGFPLCHALYLVFVSMSDEYSTFPNINNVLECVRALLQSALKVRYVAESTGSHLSDFIDVCEYMLLVYRVLFSNLGEHTVFSSFVY